MTLRDASTRRLSATPFPRRFSCLVSAPKGIRTPVPALRGLRPSPLDDTATAGKISLAARTARNPTVDLGQVLLTLNPPPSPRESATVPRAAQQDTHPYEAVWKALSYGCVSCCAARGTVADSLGDGGGLRVSRTWPRSTVGLRAVRAASDIFPAVAVSSRGLGRSPLKAQTRVRIPLPLFPISPERAAPIV